MYISENNSKDKKSYLNGDVNNSYLNDDIKYTEKNKKEKKPPINKGIKYTEKNKKEKKSPINKDIKYSNINKGVKIYLPVTVFCLVFFLIYDQFSHGVRSPYMTYLFLWPLILGFVPGLFLWLFPQLRGQKQISANLYHAGVAAVTVSSLLRGIFEIAGTASDYQEWLMIAGGIMLIGGAGAYFLDK